MNRAEKRRHAREAARSRRAWLRGVNASDLPDDAKTLARVLAEVADDDGVFYTSPDGGTILPRGAR